jgi:hypothetical protein
MIKVVICFVETKFVEYFTPESKPYGLSYGQWTAKWWQWFVAIPETLNPGADETGENASIDQYDHNVWFLAGTFGGKTVERKCTIPGGRAVLFPVINYEMNKLEKPELKTESELVKHVIQDQDDIINLDANVDRQNIPIYRVRSEPSFFTITAPEDNAVQIPRGGTTQATADGYWVFLKPLPLGEHDIYFSGSCSAATRNVKAGYHITVE